MQPAPQSATALADPTAQNDLSSTSYPSGSLDAYEVNITINSSLSNSSVDVRCGPVLAVDELHKQCHILFALSLQVGTLLGQGQFSHVYLGRHKATGTQVALKRVRKGPNLVYNSKHCYSLGSYFAVSRTTTVLCEVVCSYLPLTSVSARLRTEPLPMPHCPACSHT
jgi:hypothetical protein